ncbi:MAG: hypothetical protein Kow0029_15960 [Candidatus Rifleibacteriota bacterium]
MQFLLVLLVVLLWILWGRVSSMKREYEERLESLEMRAHLYEDRIDALKKQLDKVTAEKSVTGESGHFGANSRKEKSAAQSDALDTDKASEKLQVVDETVPSGSVSAKVETVEKYTKSKPAVDDFATISFSAPDVPGTEEFNSEEVCKKVEIAQKPEKAEDGYSWLKAGTPFDQLKNEKANKLSDKKSAEMDVAAEEAFQKELLTGADVVGSDRTGTPTPPPPGGPILGESWNNFISNVDWERFTGTQLSAWLGGIALFIGAGFFVKYSIDKNLISPILRLVIGAVLGLLMIGGSFWFERGRYDVMRQTFSAGGIGVLYSVFFAATLYYEYLPKTLGLASLVVVSAAAFVLAVFNRGVSISVLGAIGAYITPLLVNTGQGNLISLYVYLAIVNLGLYQVIKRLASNGLLLFSTLGTMISLGLASVFSRPEPMATHVAIAWLGHLTLYAVFLDRLRPDFLLSRAAAWTARLTFLAMPLVAFLLTIDKSGSSPMLLIAGSVAIAVALAFRISELYDQIISYSAITFIVTVFWSFYRFTPDIDNWAFLLFFAYGLAAGAGPVILVRKNGLTPQMLKWCRVFPVGVALLALMAVLINPNVSFLFWPMTIGLQLIGIAVSLVFGAVFQVGLITLILIIAALRFITFSAVLSIDITFFGFILMAGTAILLVTFLILKKLVEVSMYLNIDESITKTVRARPALTQWMSASPVMGVFFVLAAAFMKASPLNPHPGMVTMVAFLTIAITLAKRMNFEHLGIVSLLSTVFAQAFWMLRPDLNMQLNYFALVWSAGLFIASLVIPFVFFKSYEKWRQLWMTWALFEVVQAVFLIYAADHIWARDYSGWIPLLLTAIKIPIVAVMIGHLNGRAERNSIIACHGGVMLFYASATPVLLLEKGWLGLVLVFEATALLWLNRRVEHPGLRWVSAVIAPVGLYMLLSYMPQLKGRESMIILNPAVLSTLSTVLALAYAVKHADFPGERLGNFNLVKYFQWLAFITGFYFVNLVVADIFSGSNVAAGPTLKFFPRGYLPQEIAYTTLWALFGSVLWRARQLPRLLRVFGILLVGISTLWLVLFPLMHGSEVAAMSPVINFGLLAYLPIIAILIFLFLKEPWGESPLSVKNLFLTMLLIAGFLCLKLIKATIFQPGLPFDLFGERTAEMAVASIAGWLIYGLAMLMWPKRLDRPFRIAGLVLIVLALIRSSLFPFKYAADFGAMTPLWNRPTALYSFIIGLLVWLTARKPQETWPVAGISVKAFWAVALALMSFIVLNVEIASIFGQADRNFSLLTRGNLSHQLAYSIGWLIHAILMLIAGIKWRVVRARQAALILIFVTSLKIFFKDLWALGQLYRVASFVGLAFVMMLVSYLYQRFLAKMGDK